MNCAICKSPLNLGEGFCPHCGTKVIPACTKCGQASQPGQTFCPGCGSPLGTASAAAGRHGPAPTAAPLPSQSRAEARPARPAGLIWMVGAIACLIFLTLASTAAYYILWGGPERGGSATDPASYSAGSGTLDPDKAPVEFTQPRMQGLSSGVLDVPIFKCTMKNISTVNLMTVEATAVFADDCGRSLPETQEVAGAPVGEIEPGDEYEVTFSAKNNKAVSARLVLKEVIYVFVPEGNNMGMFKVPMTWKNKKFDDEMTEAKRSGR